MKLKTSHRGFTLIELMVVVAIIAILTGIVLASLTGSKARSRDARRVSDLNQIQLALEQYFDRCGQYPTSLDVSLFNGCPTGNPQITLGSYISVIPTDPTGTGSYTYTYSTNNNSQPTDYVLHATMESTNPAQQNSFSESSRSALVGTWQNSSFHCYNTTYTTDYCISTK